MDGQGNLYGTTQLSSSGSDGSIFEIVKGSNTITTLATFSLLTTGSQPNGLLIDSNGNLYGTTAFGGSAHNDGVIYKMAQGSHTITPLAVFDGTNGSVPAGTLLMDRSGNLFGTSLSGVGSASGGVFELASGSGTITTLATFNGANGNKPNGNLVMDDQGNIYGTTIGGGANLDGTVFEVAAGSGAITTLATFSDSTGTEPGPVIIDSVGNLFGMTQSGGPTTLFEVAKGSATITTLASFDNSTRSLIGDLWLGDDGALYAFGATNTNQVIFQVPSVATMYHLAFTQQPTNAKAGATLSPVISVAIEDQNNNIVTSASATLTLSVASGPGTIAGTTMVQAVNGLATFSDLSLATSGTYTLSAADAANRWSAAASNAFVIGRQPARLVFIQQPRTTIAGNTLSPAVQVAIEDINGSIVSDSTANVTLTVMSGPGTLGGTATEPAVNGIATFSDLVLTALGNYTLKATDATDNLSNFSSAGFAIVSSASKLVFIQQPTSVVAGNVISPAVRIAIEDPLGTVITSANSTLTVSLASGPGTMSGTFSVQMINGVATFSDLLLTTAGVYKLSASDPADGINNATSSNFSIRGGSPVQLMFSQPPSTVLAGQTISPVVKVAMVDAYGNTAATTSLATITLSLATGPAAGTLTGTLSTNAQAGVATFNNLAISAPGWYTMQAVGGGLTAAAYKFFITPNVAVMHTFNSATDGSMPESPLILDASGNFYGTTSSGGSAGYGSVYTIAASSNAFNVLGMFDGTNGNIVAGKIVLDANGNLFGDSGGGGTSGNGTVFEVAAGSHVISTVAAIGGAAGFFSGGGVTMDKYGNLFGTTALGGANNAGAIFEVPAGSNTVTTLASFNGSNGQESYSSLLIDDSGNLYGVAYKGGAGGAGTVFKFDRQTSMLSALASFDGTNGSSPYSGLVMDIDGNLYGTTEYGGPGHYGTVFEIPAGSTSVVTLATFNGSSNGANPVGDLAIDSAGNLFGTAQFGGTGNHGTVFMIAKGSNIISTLAAFNGTNGSEPYSGVTVDANGNLFGATQFGGINDAGVAFELPGVGIMYHLAFLQQPGTTTAGVVAPVSVAIEDQYSSVVTGDNSPITIALTDGAGTLTGTTTAAAMNGIATFSNLSFATAGTFTLATYNGHNKLATTSGSFSVTPGTPAKLAYVQLPFNLAAGQSFAPTVAIEDSFGNIINTSNSTVMLNVSGPASLGGPLSVQAARGVATFPPLMFTTAGSYTLSASDSQDSLAGFDSSSFTVSPAAPSHLVISQPAAAVAGSPFTLSVAIEDAFNNTVTTDTANITITVATGPGQLGGTKTNHAVNGIAAFTDLNLPTAGTYTLSAADSADSLSGQLTGSITVTPATASKLVVLQQPTSAVAGTTIGTLQIAIEDAFGNLLTNDASTVSISLPGDAGTLSGTTAVRAINGIAAFGNISLAHAGHYTLIAGDVDDQLTGFATAPFTISPAAPQRLAWLASPADTVAGVPQASTLSVAVEDAFGNTVIGDSSTITIPLPGGSLALTLHPIDGVATFSSLTLTKAGTFVLTASRDGLQPVASTPFTIHPAAASQLIFLQIPSAVIAGLPMPSTIQVGIADIYGNILTDNQSAIALARTTGPGNLFGTVSVAAVDGIATFTGLSVDTVGTYTLSAADSSDALAGFLSFPFTATPEATNLSIQQQPAGAAANGVFTMVVAVQNDSHNLVVHDGSTVTLSIASGPAGGKLGGTLSSPVINGIATFANLTLNKVGSYTLRASDGALLPVDATITVSQPATHLAFSTQPAASIIAGQTLSSSLVIQILDATNHLVAFDNSTVMIALTTANGASLSGTTSVQAINGVATFTGLTLAKTGTYTLKVTDGKLAVATSKSFTVTPDLSTSQLAFSQLPADTVVGKMLAPTLIVKAVDQFNNPITADHSRVVLSITNPAGSTFAGTTTVTLANAQAAFSNILLPNSGTYKLAVAPASGSTLANTSPISFTQKVNPLTVSVPKPAVAAAGYAFGASLMLSTTFTPTMLSFTGVPAFNYTLNGTTGTLSGTLSAAGFAKFVLPAGLLDPGTYSCTINYPGDINHTAAASPAFSILINQASTTTTLKSAPVGGGTAPVFGQPITLTATVASAGTVTVTRTGTITFYDGKLALGTVALSTNTASYIVTPAKAGSHAYTAVYSGDTGFKPSTSPALSVTVARVKPVIALHASVANPISTGEAIPLTIQLTPPYAGLPTGTITLKDGAKVLRVVTLDASASTSVSLSYTSSGMHQLTAIYSGDASFLTVTSSALLLTIG
jgi:uncharacterized repeat protein (TIGR03803 family)